MESLSSSNSREHRLLEQGCGETRFPHTPTRWEGLGGLRPPKKYVHPVSVRRSRMDGCGDHRSPGSAPLPASPPLGGGARFPPPAGAGQGRNCHRARGDAMRAGRPRSQVMGIAAVCAMRMTVSREHSSSARGVGKPGVPIPQQTRAGGPRTQAPSPGRVWQGCALPGRTCFHPVGVRRSRMDGCSHLAQRPRSQEQCEHVPGWLPG